MKESTCAKAGITELNENRFIRNCPQCNTPIEYSCGRYAVIAAKKKLICKDCKSINTYGAFTEGGNWFRKCPKCLRVIEHKNKTTCLASIREKHICRSCAGSTNDPLPKGVWFDGTIGKWGAYQRKCPNCPIILTGSKSVIVQSQLDSSLCLKCSKTAPRHPMTQEQKKGRSEQAFRRWATPGFKEKLRPILSNAAHKRWANPEFRTKVMKTLAENARKRREQASIASSELFIEYSTYGRQTEATKEGG